MPRNMSFMLTTDQIKNKSKTVTRRNGWWFLKPGDVLNAVEKCQGLKKGEKVKRICQIRVVWSRFERLDSITDDEVKKEGFPDWTKEDFINMYTAHNKCLPDAYVHRIEFEYMP